MSISFSYIWVSAMGEILRKNLETLTRYSANDPEFSVNDQPLFTGCRDRRRNLTTANHIR